MEALQEKIEGCLLGTAVGDAWGLPFENLPPKRARKLFKDLDRHHFFLGRGLTSDDAEHACLTARALAEAAGDESRFGRSLAGSLRRWLLTLPPGVGWATLRSCMKLWAFVPAEKSGVYSAGNGPAMRAPVIGVCYYDDPPRLEALVKTCTRVTHTDPQAEHGAMVAALAAGMSSRGRVDGRAFLSDLRRFLSPSAPVFPLIERAVEAAEQGWPVKDFVRELGLEMGVTGFINHTMPVVVHAWLRHPGDFRTAVRNVIARGGDTDTTAAILGGIIGAGAGRAGLPEDLLKGLWSWPLTQEYIRRLAEETAEAVEHNRPARPPRPLLAAHLARNLFALAVVVGHGFRRLGPPY